MTPCRPTVQALRTHSPQPSRGTTSAPRPASAPAHAPRLRASRSTTQSHAPSSARAAVRMPTSARHPQFKPANFIANATASHCSHSPESQALPATQASLLVAAFTPLPPALIPALAPASLQPRLLPETLPEYPSPYRRLCSTAPALTPAPVLDPEPQPSNTTQHRRASQSKPRNHPRGSHAVAQVLQPKPGNESAAHNARLTAQSMPTARPSNIHITHLRQSTVAHAFIPAPKHQSPL